MEPVTHFLTGACIGRAGLNRKTALATATVTLAAEAPDLDVVGNFKGGVVGFAHHRGFTHSFLGLIIVSAFVVGCIYLIWRIRGRKLKDPSLPPRWGLLFVFAYIAGLSHILLDYTNAYGIRPFWPFSEKWYSWDIVSIVEPVMLVFLVAGLVLPSLFRLINEEIGARRRGPQGRMAAIVALVGLVFMWGVRDYEHRRALNAMDARTYDGADPIQVSAYPYMINPFRWYGVAETNAFFARMEVNSAGPDVDPGERMQIRYKPAETPITLAAKKSYLGQVYLDWAAYPVTETEQVDRPDIAYIVRFIDLRYVYPDESRTPLSARVFLDRDLKVIAMGFGFRRHGIAGGESKGDSAGMSGNSEPTIEPAVSAMASTKYLRQTP